MIIRRSISIFLIACVVLISVLTGTTISVSAYRESIKASEVVDYMNGLVDQGNDYQGYCLLFVTKCWENMGFQGSYGWGNAANFAYYNTVSTSRDNIPIGADVFFTSPDGNGHIGIYVGDGYFVHAGSKSTYERSTLTEGYYYNRYTGWGWHPNVTVENDGGNPTPTPTPDFTPVDIGTGFYASIDNTKAAKPIIASGNNVVLGEMSGEQNQIWRFERQDDTSYKITNAATGTCLDDENYGTVNESNIQVCASNDSTAQRWYFKVVGNGYSLVPKCALQSCVDIHNGVLSAGSNVQLFQQNASDAQIFSISLRPSFNAVNKGESFTAAIIFNATGSAVTAFENNNVGTKQYTGNNNQLWNFERMGNRSYKITNVATGKCLDDENYGTADKTNIQVCSSNGSYAQRWFLKPVSDGFSLAPQCALNSCIDSYDGGTTDGQNIYLWTQNATAAQIVSLRYVIAPDYEVTFQGHEYKLYNKALPWREAYKFCEQQGGHLVTINSEEEQTFIYNFIKNKSTRSYTWLGSTDWYVEGNWKWITGSGIVYRNWEDGEPNNSNDEDFMMLYKDSGKWNDGTDIYYSDTKDYSFICEIDNDNVSCSLEKTFDYNGHRYEVYTNNVDWQTAKRFCEQKGGHLVTITSANENNAIKSNVNGLSNERYWLGLTDIDLQSTWKWITGESFSYKNWTSGEPNNNAGIESYAEFNVSSGKWNDLLGFACVSLNIGFICEYDTIPKVEIQSNHVTVKDVVTTSDATTVSPSVTVKVNNKTLTKNTDYTVSVTADISKGTGTVTVTGKGNYSGTVTKSFKITVDDRNTITDSQGYPYKADQGEIVSFIIKLTSPLQVNHLNGIIYYSGSILDPIITDDMSYHTPAFGDAQFRQNNPDQIEFDIYSSSSVNLNNSTVIQMQFRVTAKGGQGWLAHEFKTPEFTWENQGNYGLETRILTNQELYIPSTEPSTEPPTDPPTVTHFILGDADGDEVVTILDATAIQRHLASLPTKAYHEESADADEDKSITILDATAIQRHLASLPTCNNIGQPMS